MTKSLRTLLIVDDEPLFARAAGEYLRDLGLEVFRAETKGDALKIARKRSIDVVLLDQQLPDGRGADLCPELLSANEQCKIVFVTAFPNFENVVEALRRGASDYLVKPCEPAALRLAVERSLQVLSLESSRRAHERERERTAESSTPFFGSCIEATRKLVELAASVDSPVLLTGETGTGKTIVGRAIHFASARREGEFVSVNCAALPESLIEAELFGYERGAFTGSAGPREGLFEMADGGSILLDEITELPLHLQARLLNVLEDQTVRRLGGRSFRQVRFRLIAATNMDPARAVEERRLRVDLYHRINVLPIRLPPLRERLEDLPKLIDCLLCRLGRSAEERGLASGEEELLARYPWPGNVRELRNVLERACLLSEGEPLRPSALLEAVPIKDPDATSESKSGGIDPRAIPTLAEIERRHVTDSLERCGGNVARTARVLGISRSTLRRKLRSTGS